MNADTRNQQVGQSYLNAAASTYPSLTEYEVVEVIGDGSCFIHAILQQLCLQCDIEWMEVACLVLQYLSHRVRSWCLHLDARHTITHMPYV